MTDTMCGYEKSVLCSLKNNFEIHGDVTIIYVWSKGEYKIVLVDTEDLKLIQRKCTNKLNIDSNGAVQHRKMVDGVLQSDMLHRIVFLASQYETVFHVNGNKLDCRKENLYAL